MNLRKSIGRALLGFYKRRKQAGADPGLANCLAAARATASRTRYAFLVTAGEDGWPNARLVEPICDLDQFEFHIGTNPALRKIREIAACPRVTLAFGNAAENANLVVHGTATVSADPATRRRYWKATWRLFFPDGPGGDDYVVIKVRAERMEILSFRRDVIPEPFGLRPVVLRRAPEGWAIEAPRVPAAATAPTRAPE